MKKYLRSGLLFLAFLSLCNGLYAQSVIGKRVVPVIADVETQQTRVLPDGNTLDRTVTGHFYRDGEGRTRLEQGAIATISDPVNRVTMILDSTKGIARKIDFPQGAQRASQPVPSNLGVQRKQLGVQTIDGIEVVGEEFVTVIPAVSFIGNAKPIEQVTQVWHSAALQLPVLVTISDPVSGKTTRRFKNIQAHVALDSKLFEVPAGFQVLQGMSATR